MISWVPPRDAKPYDLGIAATDPDRIVNISRTSGSTGAPKEVPTTMEMLLDIVAQRLGHLPPFVQEKPRLLCAYNLGIRAVRTRVLSAMLAGGDVTFAKPEDTTRELASGKHNWFVCLEGDARGIVENTARPPNPLLFDVIGAAVSPGLRRLIHGHLGAMVMSAYSSNETGVIAYTDDDNVGHLVAGAEAMIGEAVFEGPGRIAVKTPTMAAGYWLDPDLTAERFSNGWFVTDDTGYMPRPGQIVVTGRIDTILNIGGVKVPSGPIEAKIKQTNRVTDAVVFIENDEIVVAIEGLQRHLARLQLDIRDILPRHVRTFRTFPMTAFPRTETGKVIRAEIKARFRDHLQAMLLGTPGG